MLADAPLCHVVAKEVVRQDVGVRQAASCKMKSSSLVPVGDRWRHSPRTYDRRSSPESRERRPPSSAHTGRIACTWKPRGQEVVDRGHERLRVPEISMDGEEDFDRA